MIEQIPPDPTTCEWAVAVVAAALVIALLTAMFLVRVGADAAGTPAPLRRAAAALLAALGLYGVLISVVLVGAGQRASGLGTPALPGDPPLVTELFASRLIDADPDITEDVALYGSLLVAPASLLLLAVGVAVLRLGTTAARVAAGGACGLCLLAVVVVLRGDTGSIVSNVAWVVGALAALAVLALLADELTHD